jgi:zinc protease
MMNFPCRTRLLVTALHFVLAVLFAPRLCVADDGTAVADGARPTLLISPANPLVALRLVFRAGSQDDPPGKEGLAALTAAMVAEGGTRSLSYEQVLEAFYPMAAILGGECHDELTVFSGTIHRDNLAKCIPLVSDMITQPRFAAEDFERLRNEALDYITKSLRGNNDEELGKWTLQVEIYKDHPYGHPDRGTAQGVRSITLDDVKDFHRRHYTRAALKLGLAGGFSEQTLGLFDRAFAGLPSTRLEIPALPSPKRPKGLEVTIVEKPADATAISIGFPIDVTRRDNDFYALAVANSYLGEHRKFNGKLMQELRSKRGLNYGDYSYIEDFIQQGQSTFPISNNPRRQAYFSIWIRPVPADKSVFALRAALWELDRLIERGMSPEDFETTRKFLLNYSKLWVQTLSRRLGYAIDGEFYGTKDLVSELAERLPKLTVDQVNSAVRKHLKSEGMKVAIVAKDAVGLRELLVSGKPTPLTYDTEGTPEDVLAEDKQIAVLPLKNVVVRIVPVEQMFEK